MAESEKKSSAKSPLIVIFLTVFIDLVGFGIVIPMSTFLGNKFSASTMHIGLLISIYSLCQFLFSPFWGSLSDRIGRRPVILISLAGVGLSYLVFAFADSFWLLMVSRGFAGMFGGNISTAHAYIADVTDEKNRSKGMGLLGAAFGLGFVFGPLLGGIMTILGRKLGTEPPFAESFPALGAAAICFLNFAFAYCKLTESLPPNRRGVVSARKGRFKRILEHATKPLVGPLVSVYFLSGLAMAQMEAMLFQYVHDQFGWNQEMANYGFAYVGIMMIITQGYLVRKWMPRFGEPLVLAVGLGMFAISLVGIAVSGSITAMAIAMTILALGNGVMRPANLGLISLLTPPEEQGAALGVTNSLASLGRVIGPVFGGYCYDIAGRRAPFVSAGVLAALGMLIVIMLYSQLQARRVQS